MIDLIRNIFSIEAEPIECADHVTVGRVTPGKGEGALGKVIANGTTPYNETQCS
jgi:hypothetical protein